MAKNPLTYMGDDQLYEVHSSLSDSVLNCLLGVFNMRGGSPRDVGLQRAGQSTPISGTFVAFPLLQSIKSMKWQRNHRRGTASPSISWMR
jgi:hypothetical protein